MKSVPMTRVLRISIGFDLVITAMLAVPGLSSVFIAVIDRLGQISGWASALAPFDPFQMFMVNLAGMLGVAWNCARWRTASWELARMDLIAKGAVAALILFYVFVHEATPVLLLFVVTEVVGGVIQGVNMSPAVGTDSSE